MAFRPMIRLTFLVLFISTVNAIQPIHQHHHDCIHPPLEHVVRGGGKESSNGAVVVAKPRNAQVAAAVASTVIQSSVQETLTSEWTRKEIGFLIIGLIAAAASCAAMWFENGLLIDVVAWLCILGGTSTLVLQRKLTDFETFRELNNEAREQVNVLKAANTRLATQNRQMEQSAKKLKKAESALSQISDKQGMTVSQLVKQVEEYKLVQQDVKTSLKERIRQTLLSVVIKSDRDQDFIVDPEEMDVLCLRLSSLPNVKFNEKAFRKVIKKEGGSIMQFSKNHLSNDKVMAKEKIFEF